MIMLSRFRSFVLVAVCVHVVAMPYCVGQDSSAIGSDAGSDFQQDVAAARSGNVSAQLRVGKAFFYGTNDENGKGDHSTACHWFEAASGRRSAEATAWLGSCYLNGDGLKEDKLRGGALIRSAADASDPVGIRFLALMYQDGNGVQRDYAQAFELFSKAVLLNDPNSFDRLANLYRQGLGTSKDLSKAVKLYTEGARLGDPWSQLQLAEMYYTGAEQAGLVKDSATALRLYEESAKQGNKHAAFYAGKMYATGSGTKQDYQKAVEYYLIAARRRFPPAQLCMGDAAEHGLGMSVNLFDAYAWYSLAADKGNPKAFEKLKVLTDNLSANDKAQAENRYRALRKNIEEE
jgi:TPR repeat protein